MQIRITCTLTWLLFSWNQWRSAMRNAKKQIAWLTAEHNTQVKWNPLISSRNRTNQSVYNHKRMCCTGFIRKHHLPWRQLFQNAQLVTNGNRLRRGYYECFWSCQSTHLAWALGIAKPAIFFKPGFLVWTRWNPGFGFEFWNFTNENGETDDHWEEKLHIKCIYGGQTVVLRN